MPAANPVNFIDPSGRDTAAEYGLLTLNTVAGAAALTSAQIAVNCALSSLASATDLVGQHMGSPSTTRGVSSTFLSICDHSHRER